MQIRQSDIQGKEVATLDGERIGRLLNVVMESTTGELTSLIVEPSEITPEGFELDSKGRLDIPFSSVLSIKDMIVVKHETQ